MSAAMFVTSLLQGTCSSGFSSSSFDSGIGRKGNLGPSSLLGTFYHGSRPYGLITALKKKEVAGTFSMVQWLRLHAFPARGTGLIPGQGTKILHAVLHNNNNNKKDKV